MTDKLSKAIATLISTCTAESIDVQDEVYGLEQVSQKIYERLAQCRNKAEADYAAMLAARRAAPIKATK